MRRKMVESGEKWQKKKIKIRGREMVKMGEKNGFEAVKKWTKMVKNGGKREEKMKRNYKMWQKGKKW